MKRWQILMAAVLAMPAGCASSTRDLPMVEDVADSAYRLGPGDEVRIAVFGFDQMANSYIVGDSGTISLPMLSTVEVAGKTPREVEATIAQTLRTRDLAPNASVSVQVQKYRPIYILGEVQKPGQYPYVPGMTVTTAVAIAGGYTFRANTREASVRRGTGTAARRMRAGPDSAVQPGDTVDVPEAWF